MFDTYRNCKIGPEGLKPFPLVSRKDKKCPYPTRYTDKNNTMSLPRVGPLINLKGKLKNF